MKRVVLAIVFIIIVAIGALVVFTKSGKAPSANTPSSDFQESTGITVSESELNNAAAVTIIYTDSGFSPSNITVKAGDVVAVKNQSSDDLQFTSNPHPIHTGNKELNQQIIPAGGSLTFTVTKRGTHGFHNHLNPSRNATIVVE